MYVMINFQDARRRLPACRGDLPAAQQHARQGGDAEGNVLGNLPRGDSEARQVGEGQEIIIKFILSSSCPDPVTCNVPTQYLLSLTLVMLTLVGWHIAIYKVMCAHCTNLFAIFARWRRQESKLMCTSSYKKF